MKKSRWFDRALSWALIMALVLPLVLVQDTRVEAAKPENAGKATAGRVLFENDFNDAALKDLTGEKLAAVIFEEDHFLFGHGKTDPQMRIENGALRIIGDDNQKPEDGRRQNNRTQLLLATDEEISEKGVVIECDYTFHQGSENAFTFASKPIDSTLGSIDSNDVWLSGIWSNAGYRTSLRCKANKNAWENPGLVNQQDKAYSTVDTAYSMKIEVSPDQGITLSAKSAGGGSYKTLQKLSADAIQSSGVSFSDCLDDNVRLIIQCKCDVSIDNLKVSTFVEKEKEPPKDFLFSSDFNDATLTALEGEDLAAALFGEENILFGHAKTDPQMRIENGALRIIGDDNQKPEDGRRQNNRTQILLARDQNISQKGVVIECDYTFHQGSKNAITFTSKPIDPTFGSIDSNDVWISGIWSNTGYRTSLRCKANNNLWDKPGIVESNDATYSQMDIPYNLKIVVSPDQGIRMYAKRSLSSSYALLTELTAEAMKKAGATLFADCLDNYVRLVIQCNCDVTIDNLKVRLPEDEGEGGILTQDLWFQNDFNNAGYANLQDSDLAAVLFGEGNYFLGQGEVNARLRIENGALRLIGDNGVAPSDGRKAINRSQFLIASSDKVRDGFVIECDYTLNEGSRNAFTFAGKPIVTTGNMDGNTWIAGIYSNDRSRTAIRYTDKVGKDWSPLAYSDSDLTCGLLGVSYKLRVELSPAGGLKLYAKKQGDSDYVRLGKWSEEDIATFKNCRVDCVDGNVRLLIQNNCDVTIDNLKVTPLAGSGKMEVSKKDFYFKSDFNDASYANLKDNNLAKAIFGKDHYLLGHAVEDATLFIEDGALRLVGDNNEKPADGTAANNRTQFLLASHPDIETDGVVIECDYTFNAGAKNAFTFVSRGMVTSNDPKKAPSGLESNLWIAGMWAGAKSRTAIRYPTDWKPIAEGLTADLSGKIGTTYHMKLEVTPDTGLALYVKSSMKSQYKRLGTWSEDDIALFKGPYKGCLDGNVRLLLQTGCDVTIDNLVVYRYGVDYEPVVDEIPVKVNGEVRMLTKGEWDLSSLVDGDFLFAVVDGKVTTNPIVSITADVKEIDIYTLTVDTLPGAGVRTKGKAALRWISKISASEYDALVQAEQKKIVKKFEVGTLMTRWEDLGNSEVLDLSQLKNGAIQQVFNGKWIKNDAYGDAYIYAGISGDIDKKDYNTRYCGVGYATVTLSNNKKLTVYGGFDRYVHARSVSQVASTAYLDENNMLKRAQVRMIKPYAAAFKGDASVKGLIRKVPLVKDGKTEYRIVIPKKATPAESKAASKIRTTLGSVTGVQFKIANDAKYREDEYEIVVGGTTYVESLAASGNLHKNQSCVRIVGNKIIISGFSDEMLDEAATEFQDLIDGYATKGKGGTYSLVAKVKEEVRMTNDHLLLDIPEYKAGTYVGTYASGNETMQIIYTEADQEGLDDYLSSLAAAGFDPKEENAIGNNRSVTCVGKKGLVHVNYFGYNGSVSIMTNALKTISYKEDEPSYKKIGETTLAVMSLDYSHRDETDGNGECFVVILEDGRYVILDGGYDYDAANLYAFLEKNNRRTDGKIEIAAWILSHSHGDHYGAFSKFTADYSDKVKVDSLVASPGVSTMYSNGYDDYLETNLPKLAAKTYRCKLYRPYTGQVMKFCNVDFEILYAPEDYAVLSGYGTITSENNAALVIRMHANGQTVLFTNDAEKRVSELLCDTYGDALKSDFFQVNHHGVGGCVKRLCEYVNPSFAMWTTNRISFDRRIANEIGGVDAHESNVYLFEKLGRSRCLVADGDIEMVTFPLTSEAGIYYAASK